MVQLNEKDNVCSLGAII